MEGDAIRAWVPPNPTSLNEIKSTVEGLTVIMIEGDQVQFSWLNLRGFLDFSQYWGKVCI